MNIIVKGQYVKKRLLAWGVALLVCFAVSPVHADVLLLLSSEAPYYRDTAQSLKQSVADILPGKVTFDSVYADSVSTETPADPYQLIVAIGSHATQQALATPGKTPVLSVFTPKNAFDALQTTTEGSQRPVSAIYLDQPLSRVVLLAELLQPDATRFGTVFGPISKTWENELNSLTAEHGIALNQAYIGHDDNPVAILRPLVKNSDLFIALPDQAILNRAIAKWILHLSFQQKVPVIGFSKAYTNAGALASIYSAPEDIGKQAGEIVAAQLQGDESTTPRARYPRYFTIGTNPAVARSLGIHLPPENELYRDIEQREQSLP